jgi:hypothetical protein
VTQMTLREAADTIGCSLSTLHRRIAVLGVETAQNDDGHRTVDTGEVIRAWEARQKARPARLYDGALSFVVDDEARSEVDAIAEKHGKSIGDVCRRLLHLGLVAYHRQGGEL